MKQELRERIEQAQTQFFQRKAERESNRLYEKIRKQDQRQRRRLLGQAPGVSSIGPLPAPDENDTLKH